MTGHIWGKSPAGGAVGKTTRSHPGTTTFPETTLVGCQPPGAVMMAAATAMRTTEAPDWDVTVAWCGGSTRLGGDIDVALRGTVKPEQQILKIRFFFWRGFFETIYLSRYLIIYFVSDAWHRFQESDFPHEDSIGPVRT